MSKIHCDIN